MTCLCLIYYCFGLWWSTKAGIRERCWIGYIGCLTTPTCSQQVSVGEYVTLYLHLWLPYMHKYLLPICTFIYTVALRGGNTTPSLSLMPFCRVWAGHRSTPEIAEVLIRSAVSACPRVGARCYPRYLGITRRSCLEAHMVLDMEYREQERLEHGPGGPIFLLLSQLCPVSSTSFHHYQPGLASERTLAPWGNWFEVSLYVSYLIIITFLCMH